VQILAARKLNATRGVSIEKKSEKKSKLCSLKRNHKTVSNPKENTPGA
jgi:hypothetical protein